MESNSFTKVTMSFNKNHKPNLALEILNDVLDKKDKGQKVNLLSCEAPYISAKQKHTTTKVAQVYALGDKYGGKHFTARETECMLCLLNGETYDSDIAEAINLNVTSVRTHIRKMINKIGCQTKLELIDLAKKSDLMQNIKSTVNKGHAMDSHHMLIKNLLADVKK